MKRVTTIISLIFFLSLGVVFAADTPLNYLIVAKGHGPGSADLDDIVALAGGAVTAKIPEIGVVLARRPTRTFSPWSPPTSGCSRPPRTSRSSGSQRASG